MNSDRTTDPSDPHARRSDAISNAWIIGFLALCIPLCLIFKSAVLPVIIIAGCVFLCIAIWSAGADNKTTAEAEQLRAQVRDLEERLANVETLNTFEERLAARAVARQEERDLVGATRTSEPPV